MLHQQESYAVAPSHRDDITSILGLSFTGKDSVRANQC